MFLGDSQLKYIKSENLVMKETQVTVKSISGLKVEQVQDKFANDLQSVSWSLAEFRHNKIVQSPHENYFDVCRQHKEK